MRGGYGCYFLSFSLSLLHQCSSSTVVLHTIILIGPIYPLMSEMPCNCRKVNMMLAHYHSAVFILLLIWSMIREHSLSKCTKTKQTIPCPYLLQGNILTNIYKQIAASVFVDNIRYMIVSSGMMHFIKF